MIRGILTLLLFGFYRSVYAADQPAISATAGLLQIVFGLVVVLGLMGVAAWLFRRIGPAGLGNKLPVKIVGGVNVGNRERILVVEVADQWLVVGVTAQNINTLATLTKQEHLIASNDNPANLPPFSTWLAKAINTKKSVD